MLPHTENRIWQLYAKALAAKTPEDTNRAVQELRTELDENCLPTSPHWVVCCLTRVFEG
jgi:hypothetical protein